MTYNTWAVYVKSCHFHRCCPISRIYMVYRVTLAPPRHTRIFIVTRLLLRLPRSSCICRSPCVSVTENHLWFPDSTSSRLLNTLLLLHRKLVLPFAVLEILLIFQDSWSLTASPSMMSLPYNTEETMRALELWLCGHPRKKLRIQL